MRTIVLKSKRNLKPANSPKSIHPNAWKSWRKPPQRGLSQQIKDAGTDPVALANITAQIDANSTALAAAIVANTPAAPAQ